MEEGGGESDGMGWDGVCVVLDVQKGILGRENCKCREGRLFTLCRWCQGKVR